MAEPDTWRWAVFTRSVVSSIGNPDAHLYRAMARSLARRGADAIFFEERGNPAMVALLRQRGAHGLDAVRAGYPELHYRTIQPRGGPQLIEWLGGVLATVDVALVQHDAPSELARAIGQLTRPHLQTYLIDSGLGGALDLEQLTERQPSDFSGMFVGREPIPAPYGRALAPALLHRFDPLPPPSADDAVPTDAFQAAVDALVDAIAGAASLARRSRDGLPEAGREPR